MIQGVIIQDVTVICLYVAMIQGVIIRGITVICLYVDRSMMLFVDRVDVTMGLHDDKRIELYVTLRGCTVAP